MLRALPFLALIALTACGGAPRAVSVSVPVDTVTVTTSNFTDADPTD